MKTGKSRVVPVERELAAKLRAWRQKNPSTRLVFGTNFDTPEGWAHIPMGCDTAVMPEANPG